MLGGQDGLLESLTMKYRDYHATLFLPPDVSGAIEAARRKWDPVMAAQICAHVTLIYPQEMPAVGQLVERVRAGARATQPFSLRLGMFACFGNPEDGVYIEVEDIGGDYQQFRELCLQSHCRRIAFSPHVTLVHPRSSSRGRDFWDHGRYQPDRQEFSVKEVAITAFDGTTWVATDRFVLGQG
jgi:2'-5' RNA ligase